MIPVGHQGLAVGPRKLIYRTSRLSACHTPPALTSKLPASTVKAAPSIPYGPISILVQRLCVTN